MQTGAVAKMGPGGVQPSRRVKAGQETSLLHVPTTYLTCYKITLQKISVCTIANLKAFSFPF